MSDYDDLFGCGFWLIMALSLVFAGVTVWAVIELVTWVTSK